MVLVWSTWSARRRAPRAAIASAVALLTGGTALVGPVAAATEVRCGSVITQDTVLAADVGPCPGAGLIVTADAITLDLNGHTVTGDPRARGGGSDRAGIALRRVSQVVVKNGTVERFDAGVVIGGGANNTISGITAQDNLNYRLVTGRNALVGDVDPDTGPFCDLGDGIAVFGSNNNLLRSNVVRRNGPYSGVALAFNADNNSVVNNRVLDNDALNQPPSGELGTICGGLAETTIGRHVQDAGIRIEGPSAENNLVAGNQILRSALAGILVTGFRVEFGMNNGYNSIRDNRISETGLRTHDVEDEPPYIDSYMSSGIVFHNAGTSAVSASYGNIVSGNDSSRNFGAGIEVTGQYPGSGDLDAGGNTIVSNTANDNFLDGIHLGEGSVDTKVTRNEAHRNAQNRRLIAKVTAGDPFSQYAGTDGADINPNCGSNVWSQNRFGTVNQRCVAANGTGRVIGPLPAAPAQAERSRPARDRQEGGGLLRRSHPDI